MENHYDYVVNWLAIEDDKLVDKNRMITYRQITEAISQYVGENHVDEIDKNDYDFSDWLYYLLGMFARNGTARKIDFFDFSIGKCECEIQEMIEEVDPETCTNIYDYGEIFDRIYDEIENDALGNEIELDNEMVDLFDFLILISLIALKDDFLYGTEHGLSGRRLGFYCFFVAWVGGDCNKRLYEWIEENMSTILQGEDGRK